MKNILYAIMVLLLFSECSPKTAEPISEPAEADPQEEWAVSENPPVFLEEATDPNDFRAQAPKPGEAREIKLGTYETFKLDNGLTVILVENHKVPRISWQLSLDYDSFLEGDKAGYTSMAGDLLMRGTENRTKAELDEEVDFLGASLNAGAGGMFASSLTRHSESILELMTDVLYHPIFPAEEFEKLKRQTISGIQSSKDDPNSISSNVASKLNYGGDHPYGELVTEATVENISVDDCKAFYNDYFRPNIAYLVVVGDISLERTKKVAEKYFGSWTYRKVKDNEVEVSQAPDQAKVAFVDKAGAVQSVIRITYPVFLQPGDKDFIPARVMNAILGSGGFSARLIQNLREDKAYTYGAGSALVSDKIVGEFRASSSVRNAVTDSAIVQFLYEMNRIRDEKVGKKELQKMKNILSGSFARSLERPQTIANFALNTALYDLPVDYYAKYLQTLNAVTVDDIQRMARKYIKPENAYITVVGNKDEVADKLGRFAESGIVQFYDFYGEPVESVKMEVTDNTTAEDVVEKYLEAIGGREKLATIKNTKAVSTLSTPQGEIVVMVVQTSDGKLYQKTEGMGMLLNEVKFDGEKGAKAGMMGSGPLEGPELNLTKEQALFMPELDFEGNGYTISLKDPEKVNGYDAYKMEVVSPSGSKSIEYYDMATGYKIRVISSLIGPNGQEMTQVVDYDDYQEVEGMYFPHVVSVAGQIVKLKEMTINADLPADQFTVK